MPTLLPSRLPTRSSRIFLALALSALVLAGCRADSLVAPNRSDCTGQPGCSTSSSLQVDPVVYASLTDGGTRLVPSMGSGTHENALAGDLTKLQNALHAGHAQNARTALAGAYAQLELLKTTSPDGTKVDLPDEGALRLELIPVANTLGVPAR